MSRFIIIDNGPNVVDSQRWLRDRIERHLSARDYSEALPYLKRLEQYSDDPGIQWYCTLNLGLLGLATSNAPLARKNFESALRYAPRLSDIHYALGQCALLERNYWQGVLYFLEAIHNASSPATLSEYMRSAGLTLFSLGFTELAHAMLWGALERYNNDPWVLETLSQYYARSHRWLDSIDVLDSLVEALETSSNSITQSHQPGDATVKQSFALRIRDHIAPLTLTHEVIQERVRAIHHRMRQSIDMASRSPGLDIFQQTGLTALNFPATLHILVRELRAKNRSQPLLETAQSLWARAHHERFDVFLTANTLGAAIHWITERLHWHKPTAESELIRLYRANPESLRAAIRVVVERFEMSYFPHTMNYHGLTPEETARLSMLQRALLYDVDISDLEKTMTMLDK